MQGFAGKHYCPRMATMNKPSFQGVTASPLATRIERDLVFLSLAAIKTYSPEKPVLIFVSSRRQTRLTAIDLIALLAAEPNPRQWMHMTEDEVPPPLSAHSFVSLSVSNCGPVQLDSVVKLSRDQNLKLTLAFGIGLHHAGLAETDRNMVEELFVNQKIQVLCSFQSLSFPATLSTD